MDRLWIIGTDDMIRAFGPSRVQDIADSKPTNAAFQREIDGHWDHIAALKRELVERGEFPPLTVVAANEHGNMFLADGNHRAIALQLLDRLVGHSVFLGTHARMMENGFGHLAWNAG